VRNIMVKILSRTNCRGWVPTSSYCEDKPLRRRVSVGIDSMSLSTPTTPTRDKKERAKWGMFEVSTPTTTPTEPLLNPYNQTKKHPAEQSARRRVVRASAAVRCRPCGQRLLPSLTFRRDGSRRVRRGRCSERSHIEKPMTLPRTWLGVSETARAGWWCIDGHPCSARAAYNAGLWMELGS
jgi:hypothetical protein